MYILTLLRLSRQTSFVKVELVKKERENKNAVVYLNLEIHKKKGYCS